MIRAKLILLFAIIKLIASQKPITSTFKLYAKDYDATIPFIRKYQFKTAGPSQNIGPIECMSYCIDLTGCYTLTITKTDNQIFCRMFGSIPLFGYHISPANSSYVYVDAIKKRSFNMTCTESVECDEANGLSCINKVCSCNQTAYLWSLHNSKCVKCSSGWSVNFEAELCFMYNPTPLNWANASLFCNQQNSSLLRLDSDVRFNFIQSLIKNLTLTDNITATWVGSSATVMRAFKWSFSISISPSYFAVGQPDNNNVQTKLVEDCLAMTKSYNYFLNDVPCSDSYGFFCAL